MIQFDEHIFRLGWNQPAQTSGASEVHFSSRLDLVEVAGVPPEFQHNFV